ncbi:MAG: HU family DNA-binding protein [Bacteroidaceae bacterium]|nr:HU family DNA-binding protein [Bacteroidaceae bacterium]MBQ6800416.1 HU family DNA-binding protein [Bacteroidaceae bacterium]
MAGKLYKGDIQEILVRETGMTDTEASEAVRQFFGHIISALETDRYVKVKNLGTFKLIDVEARQSVDVTTGGRIEIPEHKKVSFVADSALKDLINKPFSHFETVELKEGVNLSEEEEVPVVEEGTADKGEETTGEETADEETAGEGEEVVDEEQAVDEELIVAENQTGEEEQLVMEEQLAVEESDKEKENVMEKEQETVDIDIEREEEQTEQVKRATLISRREELRELERQMALEEGKNKWAMGIIIILMALFVLAGLLFLFAPEFLEQLFF